MIVAYDCGYNIQVRGKLIRYKLCLPLALYNVTMRDPDSRRLTTLTFLRAPGLEWVSNVRRVWNKRRSQKYLYTALRSLAHCGGDATSDGQGHEHACHTHTHAHAHAPHGSLSTDVAIAGFSSH
jgi:hypothetical protein